MAESFCATVRMVLLSSWHVYTLGDVVRIARLLPWRGRAYIVAVPICHNAAGCTLVADVAMARAYPGPA